MQNESISESLTYVSDEPDIKTLKYAYLTMTAVTGGLARAVTTASMVLMPFLGRVRPMWSAMLLMSALHGLYHCSWHP